jgi:hypothetical protein
MKLRSARSLLMLGTLLLLASIGFAQSSVLVDQLFPANGGNAAFSPIVPINSGQFTAMTYFKLEFAPTPGSSIGNCQVTLEGDLPIWSSGNAISAQNCAVANLAIAGPVTANNIRVSIASTGAGSVRVRVTGALTSFASASGMTWPSGGAGIPNYSGSNAWGATYNASNQIPASFISILNQNTTGNALTATTLNTNGAANQVWGMNGSGSVQGWQTVSSTVTSVFARSGAVTAQSGDYTCAQVTNCPTLSGTGLVRNTGAATELSGDVTTSGSNAAKVVGINNTLLSGLATGILKNTTGTGVPSIAAAGTDYAAATGIPISSVGSAGLSATGPMRINATGVIDILGSGTVAPAQGGTGVGNTATLTLGTSNRNYATLGTGIEKNTTTTGAVTNAVAADVYGLFTTCTGSSGLFLKDGGTCAVAYTLPAATSSTLGGVKPDGTTILNSAGAISVNYTSSTYFPFQSITTTGSSGAATLSGGVLNIPVYSGGSGPGSGTQYDLSYWATSSTLGSAAPTSGYDGVPQVATNSTTSNVFTAGPTTAPQGVAPNPQTGTTYTYLLTDRLKYVSFSNSSSIAVTLPQAGSSGFGLNWANVSCDIGTGTATITPTTSTISYTTGTAYTSGASSLALSTGQCAWIYSDNTNYFAIVRSGSGGGDTITSPNSTLAVGGTSTNTTLDLEGSAGEIMAGATPALTYTPSLGKSGTAGTLSLYPASGNFTTTLGSVATASNTVDFFATAPTTGDLIDCVTSSTTCTLTDAGFLATNVVRKDTTNAGAAAMTLDMHASTSAPSVQLPNVAGGTILAGTSTANLSAPIVIQNTNSSNNNTSITMGITAPGTSTGQTVLNVNGASTGGDLFDAGTGGTWASGVLSGQTIQVAVTPTGQIKTGTAPTVTTPGTGFYVFGTEGTEPASIASGTSGFVMDSTSHCPVQWNNAVNYGCVPVSLSVKMTADWTCGTGGTVTGCAAGTIVGASGTPLTLTLPLAAVSWYWECDGVVGQATAATANTWSFLTATNAPTNMEATYLQGDSATTFAGGATTGISSTTATAIGGTWTLGASGTKMPFQIRGTVEGASASGTVLSLYLTSGSNSDLITIYRGAKCSATSF